MVDQGLVEYIRTNLSQGYSWEQLRGVLMQSGWPQEEVDAAINFVSQGYNQAAPRPELIVPTQVAPKKKAVIKKVPKKYIVIGVVALVVIFGVIIAGTYFWLKTPGEEGGAVESESPKVEAPAVEPVSIEYACTSDSNCDDYQDRTTDTCSNPGTPSAACSYTLESELSANEIKPTVSENETIKFNLGAGEHSILVESVGVESVTLVVASKTQSITLKVGENRQVDIDGDATADISIELKSLNDKKITLRIKRLGSFECSNDFGCEDEDPRTIDTCVNPGIPEAACTHILESGLEENQSTNESEVEVTDYGTDFNSFITASETCALATVRNSTTLNIFGIEHTTASQYELNGLDESGKCTFYIKTESININYSAEMIQQALDAGSTQEEIDQQLLETNQQYDQRENRSGTCKFNATDLSAMLTRWNDGSYSGGASCTLEGDGWNCTMTGDWEVATDCQGEYFSQT